MLETLGAASCPAMLKDSFSVQEYKQIFSKTSVGLQSSSKFEHTNYILAAMEQLFPGILCQLILCLPAVLLLAVIVAAWATLASYNVQARL
jgi:hypothetical protein